jgi:hypothetical protein
MRTAVVTIVAGRHRHLRAQQLSLAVAAAVPDVVVVVAMNDPSIPEVVTSGPFGSRSHELTATFVEQVGLSVDGRYPLARARNVGAARALAEGADLLVFLDVDCLAGPRLLSGYSEAAVQISDTEEIALFAGPVAYLPPLPPGFTNYPTDMLATARPHPARPAPPPGVVEEGNDLTLFWSLSFAVTATDWERIGGFDEQYDGYGAEDTDFAQRAAGQGARLWWVGDAFAHHQWHPVSDPPVEHLSDIVRNANRFHHRWGWFPMRGWLDAFQDAGLAEHRQAPERWVVHAEGR